MRRILFFLILAILFGGLTFGGIYIYKTYFTTSPATESETVNSQTSIFGNEFILKGVGNGGNTNYPQSVGGVDDYNNGSAFPTDSYYKTWTICNAENKFCNTNDSNAERLDPNTGLVWSKTINQRGNWFIANNCKYPNALSGDDGVCDTNGETACQCVKHSGRGNDIKTGCEAQGDGSWRLPDQKELMQAYIDGSYANLTDTTNGFWASTTRSNDTQTAWTVHLNYGNTSRNDKTVLDYATRCVR